MKFHRKPASRSISRRTLRSRHGNIYTGDPTTLTPNLQKGYTSQAYFTRRSVSGQKLPHIYGKYQKVSNYASSIPPQYERAGSIFSGPKSQSDVYQEISIFSDSRKSTNPSAYWFPLSHLSKIPRRDLMLRNTQFELTTKV